jgi:uncharacterized membrane-anchored protein
MIRQHSISMIILEERGGPQAEVLLNTPAEFSFEFSENQQRALLVDSLRVN